MGMPPDIDRIIRILRSAYGRPVLDSYSRNPFQVLISTILSQRTRDENTALASSRLFKKYPTASKLASATPSKIIPLIKPAGFYNNKAKTVIRVARLVKNGVPSDVGSLLKLPGVGRKTANCVLVYGFGKHAIPVDIHVFVASNRIGWVNTKTPDETEFELYKVIPQNYWGEINSLLVRLGQAVCRTKNPRCGQCPIAKYCKYYNNPDERSPERRNMPVRPRR